MPNELIELPQVEQQLNALAPTFEEALEGSGIPIARFKRTVLMSIEKTPKLLSCTRQSLFAAASTASIVQLECDGHTGQGFILPFNNTKQRTVEAQFLTGYKGFNTLAARAGCTLTSGVFRDGDEFDYDTGSSPFIHHKRKLGREFDRPILGAYSLLMHPHRKPIPIILSLDEITAIAQKSAAGGSGFSPWKDPKIGFPAMAEKSAKRRQARHMPLNTEPEMRFHYAARIDELADEMGQRSYLERTPDGPKLVTSGAAHEKVAPAPQATVADLDPFEFTAVKDDGGELKFKTAAEYKAVFLRRVDAAKSKADLNKVIERNKDHLDAANEHAPATVGDICDAYQAKLKTFS